MLTPEERMVIETLLQLVEHTFDLLDDSEDAGEEYIRIERTHYEAVSEQLDKLDDLPDDREGIIMGIAAKAAWALRRVTNV